MKERQVEGVLVNGTAGEGMSLTVAERKKVAEAWVSAGRAENITVVVQIGGAPYPDVIELAKHAEKIGVEAVLCLPELYFKPKTEGNVVGYLLSIAKHCPSAALLYYHIPMYTNVALDMPCFLNLAEENIPNFAGIKYSSTNLDGIASCVNSKLSIFPGANASLCAAFAMGFDSAIPTTLNLYPELCLAILKGVKEGNLEEARRCQRLLNEKIVEVTKRGE